MAIRDWKSYNSKLIKRGEFYINPRLLSLWNDEIKEMNHKKIGNPYLYPESMIEFLAILHAKGFAYRELQGVLSVLSKIFFHFPIMSYSQINRRMNAMSLSFDVSSDNDIVAVDGSGIKVSNRGEWIQEKWKVKRGWIKVVIMGTPDGKIINLKVGDETLNEIRAARAMLQHKKTKKFIADGLHDCKKTFNLCKQKGIESVIKIRENASTKARGSLARKEAITRYRKLGYETRGAQYSPGEKSMVCIFGRENNSQDF